MVIRGTKNSPFKPKPGAQLDEENIFTEEQRFDDGIIVNEPGGVPVSRFEGDTNQFLLFLDAVNDRVGIGTNTPDGILTVIKSVSKFRFGQGALDITPTLYIANSGVGGKAGALLVGTAGVGFSYENTGYFAFQVENRATLDTDNAGAGAVVVLIGNTGNMSIGDGTAQRPYRFTARAGLNSHFSVRTIGGNLQVLSRNDANTAYALMDLDALTLIINSNSGGDTRIGSTPNHIAVSGAGLLTFVGTGGMVYGSFYGNNIAFTSIAFGGGGTFVIVSDTDITGGQVNNTTFQNDQELLVAVAGDYMVNWSISGEIAGANKHIECAPGINGVANVAGRTHAESGHANEEFVLSGTAILTLAATNTLSLMITNIDDNTQITIEHINLTAVMVGG